MKFKLHQKIIFLITLIPTILLVGIYLFLSHNLKDHSFERIRSQLFKEAALAKTYLQEHTPELSVSESVDQLADIIGNDLDLRVTIMDDEGVVLGDSEIDFNSLAGVENHFFRPEVQKALKEGKGEHQRFSRTIQRNFLYVAYPFGEKEVKGFIRLSIPLSEIEFIMGQLRKTLIVALGFAFALSIIFSVLVSNLIFKPIQNMSFTAKGIAGGDFTKKVPVTTDDEIGDLGQSINYMSKQIKNRMKELTISRSRFEAVLLNMFDGVMVVDVQGMILLMNQNLKRFLSVVEDEKGKKPLEIIRHPDIQEIVDKSLKEGEQRVTSHELTIVSPEEKTLMVHATPVVREGKLDGAVLVFHDITNLRQLENIRKDFVANVSHELRTPITNIKGYSETLKEGAIEDKNNAKDFVEIIYNDATRLEQLVEDLLDLSEIESGKLNLNQQFHDLKIIIERVLSGVKKKIEKKGITYEVNIPKDFPKVFVDEKGISQVFLNLIDNAIKYNEDKGQIIINCDFKEDHISVEIRDTGIGIPDEDLARVFERFYRVDKARSSELGGTGLGLAITKHIIQAHRQEITVTSKLNQGTSFHFTLPIG